MKMIRDKANYLNLQNRTFFGLYKDKEDLK